MIHDILTPYWEVERGTTSVSRNRLTESIFEFQFSRVLSFDFHEITHKLECKTSRAVFLT